MDPTALTALTLAGFVVIGWVLRQAVLEGIRRVGESVTEQQRHANSLILEELRERSAKSLAEHSAKFEYLHGRRAQAVLDLNAALAAMDSKLFLLRTAGLWDLIDEKDIEDEINDLDESWSPVSRSLDLGEVWLRPEFVAKMSNASQDVMMAVIKARGRIGKVEAREIAAELPDLSSDIREIKLEFKRLLGVVDP